MRTVQTLIEECVTLCGSQSALARRLKMTPGDVNVLISRKRPISPETVAALCDLLELDGSEARSLAAEAMIARAKPGKREVLRRAFFACWGTGVAFGAGVLTAIAAMTYTADARTIARTDLVDNV